jgi:hypothetical protein
MDEDTQRWLMSNVDSNGNPKWEPPTFETLSRDEIEGLPEEGLEDIEQLEYDDEADLAAIEEGWQIEPTVTYDEEVDRRSKAVEIAILLGIFLFALLPRLYFMYFVADPDVLIPSWSNDTWHRWQIAYFSKEVGFSQEFLRLWDLKGLEYYWGILHPFLTVGLFSITGSVDVMILRWITLVAGALNIVFIYLIGRRYWNEHVGFAAVAITSLCPIIIFNDPSGMVEPLGFLFLLAGIYFFPRRSILTGFLWALAAMSRAEAWLLSAGLLVAAMFSKEPSSRKIGLGLGWAVPILVYMKYLLDRTGNAIYPVYWNFLANAAGKWEFREEFADYQIAARPFLGAIFVIAVVAAIWVMWKRPKAYLLYLLGLGTTAFISGFIGLTAYLKSYEPWFWLTRFFVFPYIFLGILLAVFALYWLPHYLKGKAKPELGWLVVFLILLVLQVTWIPVLFDVNTGYTYRTSVVSLEEQGEFIGNVYEGGTVLIPESVPQFTYAMGRYSGIQGENILGQMYGPIYYYEAGDPYEDWEIVGPQMWDWFERENVTLLVTKHDDRRFLTMIEEHPERFLQLGTVPNRSMQVYKVQTW